MKAVRIRGSSCGIFVKYEDNRERDDKMLFESSKVSSHS